jgi:hypothetical protein
MVDQDRHQENHDQDGEPKDPWLEEFHAERAAMDKKLTARRKESAARRKESAARMAESDVELAASME